MQAWLLVFVGGGIGSAMRHGVNVGSARLLGTAWPWGTLTVNVVGSLVMGLLAAAFIARGPSGEPWRLFLATGVLGGFTTFSAFSLDAALLIERQQLVSAAAYIAASVLASIGALFLGLWITRSVL